MRRSRPCAGENRPAAAPHRGEPPGGGAARARSGAESTPPVPPLGRAADPTDQAVNLLSSLRRIKFVNRTSCVTGNQWPAARRGPRAGGGAERRPRPLSPHSARVGRAADPTDQTVNLRRACAERSGDHATPPPPPTGGGHGQASAVVAAGPARAGTRRP